MVPAEGAVYPEHAQTTGALAYRMGETERGSVDR